MQIDAATVDRDNVGRELDCESRGAALPPVLVDREIRRDPNDPRVGFVVSGQAVPAQARAGTRLLGDVLGVGPFPENPERSPIGGGMEAGEGRGEALRQAADRPRLRRVAPLGRVHAHTLSTIGRGVRFTRPREVRGR